MSKHTTTLLTLAIFTTSMVSPAHATSLPSFPSCVNPQGTVIASYNDGVHGIAGQSAEYRGKDDVYALVGNDQVMQCFCPENGNGIQTNWLKVSDYTEETITDLKNEGWIYIADGSAWGLDGTSYIAKNSDYSCKTSSNTSNTTSSSNTSTSSSPSSSSPSSSSNSIGEVLSLASTGNIAFLYALVTLGFLSLLSGLILKLKNK
jgi:hypothetical protein